MAVLVGRKAPHLKQSNCEWRRRKISFLRSILVRRKFYSSFTLKILHLYVQRLHAFKRILKFEKRDTAVVACSTDTKIHWGWLQVENLAGGIKGVTYPIVADTNKTISKILMC